MASGIQKATVDLDLIFAAYVTGRTKAATVGIKSAGADISDRYSPLSYGTSATATGIKKASADLNTIFAKIGTDMAVSISPGIAKGTFNYTATVEGGVSPFTYLWTVPAISTCGTINSGATLVTCNATYVCGSPTEPAPVELKVQVTDSLGNVAGKIIGAVLT